MARKRILFVAEAVTLAHVARPLLLARSLDVERYEIHFACADHYEFVLKDVPYQRWKIHSIPTQRFLRSLATGSRLYDLSILAEYVAEDRRLLTEVKPQLVVGDFRLSLAVSAPLCGVPYAAIANAHWSPYARGRFPLPEMPITKYLGFDLTNALFQMVWPAAFAHHARPLNRLRRDNDLAPVGDLRGMYVYGDYTLYADVPALIPTFDRPATHHYIGPIVWSPQIDPPAWWEDLPRDRPCVYVTFGSSGRVDMLGRLIRTLAQLPVNVMVATAGRTDLAALPPNVWASDYLHGEDAARRSDLVICNGGSGTAYQALAAGVPILGIPDNMDQYLTMRYVQEAGAGICLRPGKVDEQSLAITVEQLLGSPTYRTAASKIAMEFDSYHASERFPKLVAEWLGSARTMT